MTSITIQGHKFEVPEAVIDGIVVGYQLQEEGEVHALRQTKLENLRNNFAPKIKVAMNGAETLTGDQITALQTEFNTYALGYKFGVRGAGVAKPRLDPLTREMYALARADFTKAYRAKYNEKPEKDLLEERVEELVDKRRDDYMKRARAILRQRESQDVSLESLGF